MSIFGIHLHSGPRSDAEKYKSELLLNITMEEFNSKLPSDYRVEMRENDIRDGKCFLVVREGELIGIKILLDENDCLYASNQREKKEIEDILK